MTSTSSPTLPSNTAGGVLDVHKCNQWWDTLVKPAPYYPVLQLFCDTASLILAWYTTRELRLALNSHMTLHLSRPGIDAAAPPVTVLLLLWLLTATGRHIYRRPVDRTILAGFVRVTESATVVSGIGIILTFFARQVGADLSRSFMLLFGPISFLFLVGSFFAAIALAERLGHRWPWPKRIAILGVGRLAHEVVQSLRMTAGHSVALCGSIVPECAIAGFDTRADAGSFAPLPVLGTTRNLAEVINREGIDRIIVACDALSEREMRHCTRAINGMGVTMSHPLSPLMPEVAVNYQNKYGLHMVDLTPAPLAAWEQILKRMMDIGLSLLLIVLLLPLFAFIAVLIRLTSEGPVLYRSRRVGRGGRYFSFWKFRSMYSKSEVQRMLAGPNQSGGHFFKVRNDPRVTPIGRLLRRFSLDELPQLFQVLTGSMSFVGPRPLPAEDLDPDGMSRRFHNWAEQRARVRPGITGLWQVRGRSDVPFERIMELDLEYITRWSLTLDLLILLETPKAVFSGRGAY